VDGKGFFLRHDAAKDLWEVHPKTAGIKKYPCAIRKKIIDVF